MESKISLSFLFVILMGFLCSSQAYTFYVGSKDGWILKPSENYNHWAERLRFQVNDTLIFKYKKGFDSILIVNKDDYYKCNKEKPIQALNDGVSEFKFHRSGPFFFISGQADKCEKGQKLIIVVMAVRNITHNAPPLQLPKTPTPPPPVAAKTPSPSHVVETPPPSPSPVPAPTQSAAACSFGGSADLVLGLSVVLGTFVGLF